MSRSLAMLAFLPMVACTNSALQDEVLAPASLDDLGDDAVEGEFVIDADVPDGLAADLGLLKIDYDAEMGAGLYRSEEGADLWTLSTALKQNLRGDVLVEHNRLRSASRTVNDPNRRFQWNLDQLGMNDVWDVATGRGVMVAVVDSGVSTRGGDLPSNYVRGKDFVQNDNDPTDTNGHGTHVAGTVGQATDNGRGMAGVAFDATVLGVRVLDTNGSGSSYSVAQGIRYAADSGADVINLSLGSSSSTSTERDAIAYAVSKGAVVVAASGNEYRNTVSYPAAYPDVIAVGAVGGNGSVAPYSNGGSALDVVAPGGDMRKDTNRDGYRDGILQETITGYEWFEGTSMASPHVAGIAAILLSAGARPGEIRDLLVSTAKGSGRPTTRAGYGLIDPMAALRAIGASSGGGNNGGNTGGGNNRDTTPPVIDDIGGYRSNDTLVLQWVTDEPTTTEVDFEGFGRFVGSGGLTTEHEMGFQIDPRSTYYFRVYAEDAAGNESRSGRWSSSP
ncbi:MAG: peptidase S8 [Myxococcales bacterium]|nr:peptidase S8 [Myxococcales bacterium]